MRSRAVTRSRAGIACPRGIGPFQTFQSFNRFARFKPLPRTPVLQFSVQFIPKSRSRGSRRFNCSSAVTRRAVILAVAQLGQTRDHRGEVVRISRLQMVQEVPHRAAPRRRFIELYYEIHRRTTSILMYYAEQAVGQELAILGSTGSSRFNSSREDKPERLLLALL